MSSTTTVSGGVSVDGQQYSVTPNTSVSAELASNSVGILIVTRGN